MFKPKSKSFTNSIQENPDKANTKKKKIYKILTGIGILLVMALVIFLIVKIVSSEPESDASVTDTFTDETKIYSKTNLVVSGGQVKLAVEFTCGDTLSYESKNYDTVLIGNQCWLAENLDYDDGCSSNGWVNESDTGWCGYYNGSSTDDTYGLLYQWSAAMNGTTTEGAQGICPSGWHLPTHDEYTTLERQICSDIGNSDCDTTFPYNTSTIGYLGDGEAPAMAASTTLWTDGLLVQDTTNFATSGLDVFPAGYRYYFSGDYFPAGYRYYFSGDYASRSNNALLWSSTEDGTNAWLRYLDYNYTGVTRSSDDKANGFSVRCLKDWTCGDTLYSEGKEYDTVLIGSQCWMAENLNYDNGCSSNGWVDSTDTGWCGYYNGSSTDDTYGLLYQWSAAMNGTTTEGAQGICPAGWYIPSHNDWTDLERQICSDIGNSSCDTTFPYNTSTTGYLGDGEAPAMAASTTLWTDDLLVQDTTNFATSGLDVFPAGYRLYLNGDYNNRSNFASLWSSTENGTLAWRRYLIYNNTGVIRLSNDKAYGFSVRCLRQ